MEAGEGACVSVSTAAWQMLTQQRALQPRRLAVVQMVQRMQSRGLQQQQQQQCPCCLPKAHMPNPCLVLRCCAFACLFLACPLDLPPLQAKQDLQEKVAKYDPNNDAVVEVREQQPVCEGLSVRVGAVGQSSGQGSGVNQSVKIAKYDSNNDAVVEVRAAATVASSACWPWGPVGLPLLQGQWQFARRHTCTVIAMHCSHGGESSSNQSSAVSVKGFLLCRHFALLAHGCCKDSGNPLGV